MNEHQVVKVRPATESEEVLDRKFKISWDTVITADISVNEMPNVEVPLIAEVIARYKQGLLRNAPKIVKGGLLEEHGVEISDLAAIISFLSEDRIEVESVVVRSTR